jgi:hypothetical protein
MSGALTVKISQFQTQSVKGESEQLQTEGMGKAAQK